MTNTPTRRGKTTQELKEEFEVIREEANRTERILREHRPAPLRFWSYLLKPRKWYRATHAH